MYLFNDYFYIKKKQILHFNITSILGKQNIGRIHANMEISYQKQEKWQVYDNLDSVYSIVDL